MANHLDVPRQEADAVLSPRKIAPHAEFRLSKSGQREVWEFTVGVTENGLYKKGLTVELLCQRTQKPYRENFKFSLFLAEYGRTQRIYQLDTTSAPICEEGQHDWPHQHIGQDRVVFGSSYPVNFDAAVAYFCREPMSNSKNHLSLHSSSS